ncbi:MAG: hypothetical protein ABIN96_17150, partial [Rubrivivax sp.]
ALAHIHRLSHGVPRRINLLADRALLGAYAEGKAQADKATVDKAAVEVHGRREGRAGWVGTAPGSGLHSLPVWCGGALLLGLALGLLAMTLLRPPGAVPVSTPEVRPTAALPLLLPLPAVAPGPSEAGAGQAHSEAPSDTGTPVAVDADIPALLAAARRSEATAWRELALHWNVAVGEGDPCTAVAQAGLACFSDADGGMALVRLLARPGIVTLRGPTGVEGRALLVGLDAEQATLQVGNTRHRLSLPSLARLWRGDFSTLWLQPPGSGRAVRTSGSNSGSAPGSISDGADRDGERRWLSQQLAQVGFGGEQPLRERIASFQIVQGLSPDGVAGPLTVMRLNRATGVDEPRLAGLVGAPDGSRSKTGVR